MKERSYEVETEKWEEMKREGKVDNCRLWIPLEVKEKRMLALYNTGTMKSFCDEEFVKQHGLEMRASRWRAATQAGFVELGAA